MNVGESERTILVTMPQPFSARNVLFTPLVHEMSSRTDTRWVLCSFSASDARRIASIGATNVVHERMRNDAFAVTFNPRWRLRDRVRTPMRRLDESYLYPALVYRFLSMHRLRCLTSRQAMSVEQRRRECAFSNFSPRIVGWPLAPSKSVYRMLSCLRRVLVRFAGDPWVERLFDRYRPAAMLHMRAQSVHNTVFDLVAERRGVPIAAMIESWDQPTTKGPVLHAYDRFLAGCESNARELNRLHGIEYGKITNTGHPYRDLFCLPPSEDVRAEACARLGVSAGASMIAMCTNAMAFKAHEVSIAARLAKLVESGRFGDRTELVIRTHPQDRDSERDFGRLRSSRVRVVHASTYGHGPGHYADPARDLGDLLLLLRAADVVINTRSSITLDAIAAGTPVVNLAYDGDRDVRQQDSVLVRYSYEFFRPLIDPGTPATALVRSESELVEAIDAYRADPSLHAEGRRIARRYFLDPFDGSSSRRVVESVLEVAGIDGPAAVTALRQAS